MEHLHLFTKIEEFTPTKNKGEYVAIEDKPGHYKTFAYWNGQYWVSLEHKNVCYPTHVLDLSKLTTKERARECIDEILDLECTNYEEYDDEVNKISAKL